VCLALLRDSAMILRRARSADAHMAWEWRNAESTRRHSFDSAPIPLDGHLSWWQAALDSHQRILLIGEVAGLPVGVLRFDLDGVVGTVSIYLDPQLTGQGLGPVLLRAGTAWVQHNLRDAQRIEAFIKPQNRASVKAFIQAGFTEENSRFVRTLFAETDA
jgi:RimJ/RimL family protein N-acetyltransferase